MGFRDIDEIDDLLEERFKPKKVAAYQMSLDMHLDLLTTFQDPEVFDLVTFKSYPLEEILVYLETTHQYYLTKVLKKIRFQIDQLSKGKPDLFELQNSLYAFFRYFEQDLAGHIGKEERQLYPYVWQLIECSKSPTPDTKFEEVELLDFLHDHDNQCEDVLVKLIHFLESKMMQYPDYLSLRILLNQLNFFMKDLIVHSLIEEKVLIPVALELEKNLIDK
ncbi:MAG: hypothetical protein JXQ90_12805 [Cyclobacteriaceae bacterium]